MFACFDGGHEGEAGVGGDGEGFYAQFAGGLGDGDVWAAEGPAAAEGDVDAEAEAVGFLGGEVDGFEVFWGEERGVVEACFRIVEG